LPGKTFYSAVIKRWQFTSQVTNDLDVITDIYNEAIKTITATLAIQSKSADEQELGVSKIGDTRINDNFFHQFMAVMKKNHA